MAIKKKAVTKKSAANAKKSVAKKSRKKAARKKKASRGKLAPSKSQRGLNRDEIVMGIDDKMVAPLAAEVQAAGGIAIGAYHEPFSGRPILLAALPINKVQPTPFQRDLSPTHTKRLAQNRLTYAAMW